MKKLTDQVLAKIINNLQVPLIVADILDGKGVLSDDVHYGLHKTISDLRPEEALLAIAVSAGKIASIYHKASPGMRATTLESNRIINDQALFWLSQRDEGAKLEAMQEVVEDLEALGELLALNASFLRNKDEDLSRLCTLLHDQAQAQSLVADEICTAALSMAGEAENEDDVSAIEGADNILSFRGREVIASA